MEEDKEIIPVPAVLSKYANELIELQREYISVNAEPLDDDLLNDPLNKKQSKFLGNPFLPIDYEYPKDKNGKPMVLIAQINFSEMPRLKGFPTSGLLQLYFPVHDWWDIGVEKIVYLNDDDLEKESLNDFSFVEKSDYDEMPVNRIHELKFNKSIDTGCSEDSQFSFSFGGLDYWDFEDSLSEREKEEFNNYFSSTGHKIGGYADFTQSDPRDYEASQKEDVQLLQIDEDDYIMFGDSGVGHIFINTKDLETNTLEKAYFYWDCC